MGVRVLHDATERQAALYDSVSMTAFGPLFADSDPHCMDAGEVAECFLEWSRRIGNPDPRSMTDADLGAVVMAFDARLAEYPETTVDFAVIARNLAGDARV